MLVFAKIVIWLIKNSHFFFTMTLYNLFLEGHFQLCHLDTAFFRSLSLPTRLIWTHFFTEYKYILPDKPNPV